METFEQTNSDQFFIHQNPFISNCVVINNSEISNSIITIYSVFGEEIASFNLLTSNNVLDFSNLTQGVYLYMIKVGSKS
ncbi:MAG: T9SS type A sorting domain-containing protein [Saprospiraceae bacterium]|nr:T9SS type A sorting domain-containing protein [Candidatus Opimibacter skivensis]